MANDRDTERAKRVIESIKYMVLATSSPQGSPWATPLFFAYDDDYNLYFLSSESTMHTNYIIENPIVAVAIFDSTEEVGTTEGVQIVGEASCVMDPKELVRALDIYYRRLLPGVKGPIVENYSIDEYLPPAKFRLFKVRVLKAYVPGDKARVEVKLSRG